MQELLLIFLAALLLFGAKRIPEIAKGLGRGITDFKRALNAPEEEGGDSEPHMREESHTEVSR